MQIILDGISANWYQRSPAWRRQQAEIDSGWQTWKGHGVAGRGQTGYCEAGKKPHDPATSAIHITEWTSRCPDVDVAYFDWDQYHAIVHSDRKRHGLLSLAPNHTTPLKSKHSYRPINDLNWYCMLRLITRGHRHDIYKSPSLYRTNGQRWVRKRTESEINGSQLVHDLGPV